VVAPTPFGHLIAVQESSVMSAMAAGCRPSPER
jgi:hypothetical protein